MHCIFEPLKRVNGILSIGPECEKQRPFITDYYIGDEIIERLSQIRDLRILLDTKLDFSAHIDSLIARAFANLGFLRRICSNMYGPYTLKCLYCAHVRSILEYASMIRQPYYQIHCDRIERIQRFTLQ